jgi:hypothetical protein
MFEAPAGGGWWLEAGSTSKRYEVNVTLGDISVSRGTVPGAHAVVNGMMAGLRGCYGRGLQQNPTMAGTLNVKALVSMSGAVGFLFPPRSADGQLSDTVTSCVADLVQKAQFSPPEGGAATLDIPITFETQ